MNKAYVLLLMTILIALPAAAANITVATPASGASWQIGSHQMITWTYTGIPDSAKVRVLLYLNGTKVDSIIENLAIGTGGHGSFEWPAGSTISVAAADGPGYVIKVRMMDGSFVGASGDFTLTPKPQIKPNTLQPNINPLNLTKNIQLKNVQSISVTSPAEGATADPYNPVSIKWTKLGAQDANVSVTLLRNGAAVATLDPQYPNNGGYNWDPTALCPDPGPYTIKVKTLDGACEGVSGTFTMKEAGGIELLSPKGGEVWENGTSHPVTWKRMGNVQTLSIRLLREGSVPQTLAQGVDAKLGTKTVTFVRASTDGSSVVCYTVDIKQSAGNTVEPSGCITLTGNPDLAVVTVSFSPPFIGVGTDVTFQVSVKNQGAVRSQPCQGDLRLNGAVQKTFSVPAIDPGQTAIPTVVWTFTGHGTIKITVDTGNANIEPDKSNNTWEKAF